MEVLDCLKNINSFVEAKSILKEKGLKIKENQNDNLYLVKYDKTKCNMLDKDVCNCRGIIVDKSNNTLVCFPPNKSMDLDQFLDKHLWENIIVEEFIDGTMINLCYYNDEWIVSTRSSIGANSKWFSNKTFQELFNESHKLDYTTLDKNYFYTFVLTHPENIIVKKYEEPNIVLVSAGHVENGVYKNISLSELPDSFNKPRIYYFKSIQELNASINTNFEFQGYILKIKDSNDRSKVRNPNYNYAKQLKGNTSNMKYLYYDLFKNNMLHEYLSFFPEHTDIFETFKREFIHLTTETLSYYNKYHIKKNITNIKDIPYRLRPLCYEIHGLYLKNKVYINYEAVYNYVLNLPNPRIIFSCSFE